jgi:hypothetical protein
MTLGKPMTAPRQGKKSQVPPLGYEDTGTRFGGSCTTIWASPLQTTMWGTQWRSWLRHYATSRKVAGSIPDGVTGISHWHNPSGRTMALEPTQSLTEMTIRNNSWGKCGRCVGLTTLPLSCAHCLKICHLNLLEPSGSVIDLWRDSFTFIVLLGKSSWWVEM